MSIRLRYRWVVLFGTGAAAYAGVVVFTAMAADWSQWRGPNRDGVSAETLTVTNWPPLLAWSNSIAVGESALAVSEGRVYTMGRSGPTNFVYCLDASTGTNIWIQTCLTNGSLSAYGSYGPQATPTVSGGAVYTFDDGGKLYCFNKTNGTVLWNTALNLKRPQYAFSSSPLVEDDFIYLNGSGAGAAVGRTSHTLAWPTGTLSVGSGYSSAVGMTVGGKRLILFQTASALKAVTTSGVVAWSYAYDSASMSGYAAADPVVWGDKILLYENGLVLLQVTTNSVSEVWPLNTDQMGAGFSTPVIVGNHAYAINNVGELVRIALSDGTVDWNMVVSDYCQGAVTAADGKLIVLTDGKLRVVTIGALGFDEGGRTPVTVCTPDLNYAWSPSALYNGKILCRVGKTVACYSVSGLLPGPNLAMDTNDVVVLCPQGTVATQSVNIVNAGDATLTWSLIDKFESTNFAKIVRQFKSGWTKFGTISPSMKYDGTNDCLWVADYGGGSEIGKLSAANGSLLGTKSMGTNCYYPLGGIELEGVNMWAASCSPIAFQCFRLSDMALVRSVPVPAGWSYACALAIGDGKWWATRYDYTVNRLNPTNGTVIGSFTSPDYMTYQFHMGYRNGSLWWGNRQTGFYNYLRKVDAMTGVQQSQFRIGQFQTGCTIHDVSFASDTQLWLLTYQHLVGTNEYWAHLLDISGVQRLNKSAISGAVPAGASSPLSLMFNGVGAGIGLWPVRLTIASNGGGPKEKLVTFVVHAAGANHTPTANAGVDQAMDATGATTPVTLNGSGSSDPDGDTLKYTWRENGVILTNASNPTLNLAPGVHDFTLTVDDYRGGVSTDSVRITINAADIAFAADPVEVLCPQGSVVTQTVTVLNVGTRTLNWTMTDQLAGTNWARVITSVKSAWNLYPYAMKYDATNNCLWGSYPSSNEVVKLSAANGSVLARKYLTGCNNPYAIEMEGTNLWVADPTANNFKCYRLSDMAVVKTVAQPAGWTGYNSGCGLAIGGGNWYAVLNGGTNVYRLDTNTGAILATYPTPDSFGSARHLGYDGGSLWWGCGGNSLRRMGASSGQVMSSVSIGQWNGSIYDVSYTGTNGQYWILTYYHNGASEFWAHLVDLSASLHVTESPRSGSIAAGGSATIQMTFDGRGLARGVYPVQLVFQSNDPDERLTTNTVYVAVHAAGANNPPVANAGPDRMMGISDPTAPFILDLSGSASSDSDGDSLRLRWTTNGAPVVINSCGLVELGVGTNIFTLTVDDYRGGTNTDTMQVIVTNSPLRDWPEWYGPSGTGHAGETNANWIQNWPPVEVWSRSDIGGGGYTGNSTPVVSEGRFYYSGPGGMLCVDAVTGTNIWWKSFPGGNPTPAVDEDRVYAVGTSCTTPAVSCWDKRTGSNIWNTTISTSFFNADGAGYYCSPMIYGDLLYLDTTALNKRTGAKVWTRGNGKDFGKRFTWNSRTYILADGYLIDPLTGQNVQYVGYTVSWWLRATTTYGNDKVWTLGALSQIGGATLWSTNASYGGGTSEIYEQPIVVGDYGYYNGGAHGAGGVRLCMDLKTGKLLWTGPTWGTWIAVGDKLVAHGGSYVGIVKTGCTNYVEAVPSYRFNSGANNYVLPVYANQRIYIGATCLYTGLSRPVLNNGAGAVWDDDAGVAVLNGELVNTGNGGVINTSAPPTQVFVYWGRSDGGTNAAAWEHCERLGAKTRGRFSASVPADSDAVCYYRCFATNNIGGEWAVGSERFTTYRRSWDRMGLVLHWPFEDGTGTVATDVSGNGNHASLVRDTDGNPVLRDVWTNGVAGKGVYLGTNVWGASEWARCMNVSPSLNSDFTFACWLSYTNKFDSNGLQITLVTLANADGGLVSVVLSDTSREGWDRRLFGPAGIGSRQALHDGLWHHLVVARQGMTYSMYVDGIWNASAAVDAVANYNRLCVGWCVKYDDVRLYKRALSAEEIARLSAIGSATNGECGVSGTTAATGSDDAEEKPNGAVVTDSWDLKLVRDGTSNQVVGVRFPNARVPSGVVIQNATIQFKSVRDPGGRRANLSQGSLVSFGTEDTPAATATVSNGGRTLTILGNAWKAYPFPYTVTTNTVLEFDYRSTMTGDVQGVGMDSQTITTLTTRIFALYGSESRGISTYKNYSASAPNVKRYSILIGTSYTGTMTHLVFMNDDDIGPTNAMSEYSDITVYEALPQSETTCLTIRGQAADAPATFTAGVSNITTRPLTDTAVEWIPLAWVTNAMGPAQMTPDLAGIMQEMVNRPGWTTNSAPVFIIRGTGQRIADSTENPVGTAACLRVVWTPMGVPPSLVCAWSTGDSNAVNVRFDRPVLAGTAVVAGNYRISGGIEVLGSAVTDDRTVVRLTTTRMTTGLVYRLTVSGIADLMTPPNCMTGSAETLFTCLPVPVQFARKDTVTKGSWIGTYGHDQYSVIGDTVHYCLYSYAQVTASGAGTYNWSNYTAEARALQRDEGGRIASAWYNSSGTNFTVDVNLTDGLSHQVAVYLLDWDRTNRCQRVDVIEPGTGRIWDTQVLGTNAFGDGVYLVWNVTGRQILRFTTLNPAVRAVMSGIFFDPPALLAGPDENHNGIADAWEIQYYGATNHTAAWFRTTDSDGDGVNDWMEYVAGTNPKSALSFLYVVGQPTAGTNGFTVRWSSASNQVYDLLRSTNLVAGFGACIGTNLTATPPMNVFTDSNVKANSVFYRVEVK